MLIAREGGSMVPVRKSLQIEADGPRLVSVVGFYNLANFDVFVLKDPPSIFIELDGEEVREIGPSEKRKPFTIADYERLPPAHMAERRRDITDLFAWRSGTHTYQASIDGGYKDPVDGRDWSAPSITASFVWTK